MTPQFTVVKHFYREGLYRPQEKQSYRAFATLSDADAWARAELKKHKTITMVVITSSADPTFCREYDKKGPHGK